MHKAKSTILRITFCLAIFSHSLCWANTPVFIDVNEDLLPDYNTFVNNRNLANINYYGGPGSRRSVIQYVLLEQALLLGGFKTPLQLRNQPSYLRILSDIVEGTAMTSASLLWLNDLELLKDKLYITQAVVHRGEFIVGVYTSPNNKAALAAKTLEDLTNLRIVTNAQWKPDTNTLNLLGFKKILFNISWDNMVRMLAANRADITLAPFRPTEDMAIETEHIKLIPIKGIKVELDGSQHWPVSRKHPQGKAFYEALERGLTILNNNGTIRRAFQECGFFHEKVANWKLLHPPVTPTGNQ